MPSRRKHRRDNLRFSSTRNRKQEKRARVLHLLIRWGAWGLIVCFVLAALTAGILGLRALLFTGNDHFRLRKVQITIEGDRTGVTPQIIKDKLREIGVIEKNVNLFELDLAHIRETLLETQVSLSSVQVKRDLPGTLEIEVRQRDPIAHLLTRQGYLLDRSGMVLPASVNRVTWSLPVITGLKEGGKLRPGMVLDDSTSRAALEFILTTRTGFFGRHLDVDLIQLDHSANALKAYVSRRPPFREGACIVLPADQKELPRALQRLRTIIDGRAEGGQTIGFVDVTYRINVPVRP